MIQPNELRVGNLFGFGSNPNPAENIIVTVRTILKDGINSELIYDEDKDSEGVEYEPYYDITKYEDLNPISLTPEILVKFGFKKDTAIEDAYVINVYGTYQLRVNFTGEEYYISSGSEGAIVDHLRFLHIQFLHQLQNLYFSITGRELEVSP